MCSRGVVCACIMQAFVVTPPDDTAPDMNVLVFDFTKRFFPLGHPRRAEVATYFMSRYRGRQHVPVPVGPILEELQRLGVMDVLDIVNVMVRALPCCVCHVLTTSPTMYLRLCLSCPSCPGTVCLACAGRAHL